MEWSRVACFALILIRYALIKPFLMLLWDCPLPGSARPYPALHHLCFNLRCDIQPQSDSVFHWLLLYRDPQLIRTMPHCSAFCSPGDPAQGTWGRLAFGGESCKHSADSGHTAAGWQGINRRMQPTQKGPALPEDPIACSCSCAVCFKCSDRENRLGLFKKFQEENQIFKKSVRSCPIKMK